MTDKIDLLGRALATTSRVVHHTHPDQYAAPTPCADWDVRTLLNHLVAGNTFFAASARGDKADMSVWAHDHLGHDDPGTRYDDTAKTALAAWHTPGATDRTAALPSGGPGPHYIDMYLLEALLHGWDLATATGQDRSLDDEVVRAVTGTWTGTVPDEVRGMIFGPVVPAAPDAPALDRLAAYLGRTP